MNLQQIIISGIKDQLFYHDYLVLPDFGGFVLKSNATHFSGAAMIHPPSKTISFNVQLRQNDGILAFWLQEKLQCTMAESLSHLKEFTAFCHSVLAAKRRLTLENIGFFYLDFENNLCFEPQADANFLASSFGLAPVSVKQIELEKTEVKKTTVFTDRTKIPDEKNEVTKLRTNKYRRLIAPAAFLILFFGLLLIFVSNNRISGQLRASAYSIYGGSQYQPVSYPDLALCVPGSQNLAYVADANGIAILELNDKKSIAVKAVEILDHADHSKISGNFTGKNVSNNYEIVLGCFGVLDNAKRMAAKLTGQNMAVVISEKNARGLYTVINGRFASKGEALAKLKILKNEFPGVWIKNP